MNILLFTHAADPPLTGTGRAIRSMVQEYRRLGYNVLVIAPAALGQEPEPEDHEQGILRVPVIHESGAGIELSTPLSAEAARRVEAFQPDIVHSHHPLVLGAMAHRIASNLSLPLVFSWQAQYGHETRFLPGDSPRLRRLLESLALGYCQLAETVLVPNRSMLAHLEARGVDAPIEIQPVGLDLAAFRGGARDVFRQTSEIPHDAFVVGYAGRLSEEKNAKFLARCLADFLRTDSRHWFLIVGEGEQQPELEGLLADRRVADRVRWMSPRDVSCPADLYAAIDVLATASHTEAQAVRLIEGMAAGVPVVAVDAPGVRDLIRDGENGRLLPTLSRRWFVDALQQAARLDEPQRRRWSEAASAAAEPYALAECTERTLTLYESLISSHDAEKPADSSQWDRAWHRLETEWQLWRTRGHATAAALKQGRHPSRVPVLRHLFHWWRRLRRWSSRRENSVKLLNLPVSHGTADEPGVILLQIDGLSRAQLDHALAKGRLPFVSRLLKHENYRIRTMYSGQPTTTPAVLGELFYGVRQPVAAFSFRDHRTGEVVKMLQPAAAARIQAELSERGAGLLQGGSAYCDIYSGGASESSFCPATTGWRNFEDVTMWRRIALFTLNFMSLLRIAGLTILEVFVAIGDCIRGIISRHEVWEEISYIPRRVVASVVLRELVTISVEADVTRGLPVVHANFLGYDENSHRRGPDALFTHYALRGINLAIRRIWNAAHASHRRNYQVWIMSDHGQEKTTPYPHRTGRTVQAAVDEVYRENVRGNSDSPTNGRAASSNRDQPPRSDLQRWAWLLRRRLFSEAANDPREEPEKAAAESDGPTTVAVGPIGYIYWPDLLQAEDIERIAPQLVEQAQIPLVLARVDDDVYAWTRHGRFRMPDEAVDVLAAGHPHLEATAEDLTELVDHPDAGAFVISGWDSDEGPMSFLAENGAHGGPGPDETSGFVIAPSDAPIVQPASETFRPTSLRVMVQTVLRRGPEPSGAPETEGVSDSLRLVTYNTHSCLGLDGRLSPARIARVLAGVRPDIVALQELDVLRDRSGVVHQAEQIADALEMHSHFAPSFAVEDGHYGNAILSRWPMRPMRADLLPGDDPRREPRGAMWVEIDGPQGKVQVITTHLGLTASERALQIETLLGPEWLGHPDCQGPVLLCGDFNLLPRTAAWRKLAARLRDAQSAMPGYSPRRTWFGPLPLTRIDYVFVNEQVQVNGVTVPRTRLARTASDHLPLVVDFEPVPQPAARVEVTRT